MLVRGVEDAALGRLVYSNIVYSNIKFESWANSKSAKPSKSKWGELEAEITCEMKKTLSVQTKSYCSFHAAKRHNSTLF
jgi:hypothetical protein